MPDTADTVRKRGRPVKGGDHKKSYALPKSINITVSRDTGKKMMSLRDYVRTLKSERIQKVVDRLHAEAADAKKKYPELYIVAPKVEALHDTWGELLTEALQCLVDRLETEI